MPGFVESYAQMRPHLGSGPRALARHAALSGLAVRGRITGAVHRALASPRVHVLCLHHLFEDEAPGFRALLDRLGRTSDFVTLSGAVELIEQGRTPARPAIAITFDDGFASCLRAADLMDDVGASGCFYVCPSIVGEADDDRLEAFCRDRLRMPPVRFMDWDDLAALRDRGHEVGSHTLTHPLIADLSEGEVADELGRSRETIASRLGACEHFAWPFGLFPHVTASLPRLARATGYRSVASAERGCHTPTTPVDPSRVCLRRDNLVAGWPVEHCLHFVTASATRRRFTEAGWPEGFDAAAPASDA